MMSRRGIRLAAAVLALGAGLGVLQVTPAALPDALGVSILIILSILLAVALWMARPRKTEKANTEGSAMAFNNVAKPRIHLPGSFGPFQWEDLPRATVLSGGFSRVFYREFDTIAEPDQWRHFLYDPLRALRSHGVLDVIGGGGEEPRLIHIAIVKVRDPDERGNAVPGDCLAEPVDDELEEQRRNYRITTSIVNHEQPLNPRIGMATVLA